MLDLRLFFAKIADKKISLMFRRGSYMKKKFLMLIPKITCVLPIVSLLESQSVLLAARSQAVDYVVVNGNVLNLTDQACKNSGLVGCKAATLHNLIDDLNIKVPRGFSVTTELYDAYLKSINVENLIRTLGNLSQKLKVLMEISEQQNELEARIEQLSIEIQSKILNGILPTACLSKIESCYKQLSKGGHPALVAVRSSATAEDLLNLSFAGQYESYLNQRGLAQVVESIKKVWASTYSIKAISYRNKNAIGHDETKMAVVVQLMVDAQSSGRAYSVDIETGMPFITIKNLPGLGEAEASGAASPDTWIVDPTEDVIIKRCLGKKQFRIEYDVLQEKTVTVENSLEQQNKYAITFEQVKKLAKEVKKIHEHFLNLNVKNVEIEYAFTNQGELFLTQARPETSWSNRKQKLFKAVDGERVAKNRLILNGGSMGWGGVVTGSLRVIRSLEDAKERHKKGDIMVVGNTTNVWENFMVASGGIISQENVTSSHAVATAREEGIPSLVGHPQAMQILQKYDGQIVTLDATSRCVYLGAIPEKDLCFPAEIETIFQRMDSVSEDEHWESSSRLGLVDVDNCNKRWLKRPVAGNRTFQHEINKKAYDWVAAKAGLPVIEEKRVVAGELQVLFSSAHRWREILREKDLAYLEWMYNERAKINDAYIQSSLALDYNAVSVKKWIDSAIEFYGIQHISYYLGQVTDGLLNKALEQKHLHEPYLSQLRPSMEAAVYGETLSKERVRVYKCLLAEVKLQSKLATVLHSIASGDAGSEMVLKNNYPDFYKNLEQYAKNYRVTESFSIDLAEPWPLKEIAQQLVVSSDNTEDEIENGGQVVIMAQEFFPDDPEFQRICRLAILVQKLKLDTHHLRCRGHWKFKEFIIPFFEFLKEKGVVVQLSEIFDHEPQWLVDCFETYKAEFNSDQLRSKRTENFEVNFYEAYRN